MKFFRRQADPVPEDGLWLIVGLGNPGARFEGTRHNVGFMVVQRLAEAAGARFSGSKFRADVARVQIGGEQALLMMPETYMNESGLAVSKAVSFYKIPVARTVVVSDDMDIPFGTVRVRAGGTAGGQKGLQSVIACLGTDAFPRVRIGIGRPERNAIEHVLQPFSAEERVHLDRVLDAGAQAVAAVLRDGVHGAMNAYNGDWLTRDV